MNGNNPTAINARLRPNQVAFPDGQGPPGQVFIIPRPELILGFYKGAAVPPWTGVAEQVLRGWLESRRINAWYLPAQHPLNPDEEAVAEFFQGLLIWMREDAGRRAVHRLHYEAVRRLPGHGWFAESEGDAAYLQLWCRGIMQAAPLVRQRPQMRAGR